MRFFIVKKDPIPCKLCSAFIAKEELCARTFNKNSVTGIGYSQYYHPECYQKHWNQQFEQAWMYWKQQDSPLTGGRPRKYKDSVRANSLKTLQRHHKSLGHMTRVEEIQKEIKELEA